MVLAESKFNFYCIFLDFLSWFLNTRKENLSDLNTVLKLKIQVLLYFNIFVKYLLNRIILICLSYWSHIGKYIVVTFMYVLFEGFDYSYKLYGVRCSVRTFSDNISLTSDDNSRIRFSKTTIKIKCI